MTTVPRISTKTRSKIPVTYVFWSTFRWGLGTAQWLKSAKIHGSDLLRLQSKAIIESHIPEEIELSTVNLYCLKGHLINFDLWLACQRRSVVILSKWAALRLSPSKVERLRRRSLAVGVDHKDADLSMIDLSLYDFHISSSLTGLRELETLLQKLPPRSCGDRFAGVWLQSPDSRLALLPEPSAKMLSTVYLGLPANSAIPASLSDEVRVLPVACAQDMNEALPKLPGFNFHFAVRPNANNMERIYKPFTKGFTAAACRSNILVDRNVDDAVDILTLDYPYMTSSNDPGAVAEMFGRAKEGFGGHEWRRGLDMMRAAREWVSPTALAQQFVSIITRAAG